MQLMILFSFSTVIKIICVLGLIITNKKRKTYGVSSSSSISSKDSPGVASLCPPPNGLIAQSESSTVKQTILGQT